MATTTLTPLELAQEAEGKALERLADVIAAQAQPGQHLLPSQKSQAQGIYNKALLDAVEATKESMVQFNLEQKAQGLPETTIKPDNELKIDVGTTAKEMVDIRAADAKKIQEAAAAKAAAKAEAAKNQDPYIQPSAIEKGPLSVGAGFVLEDNPGKQMSFFTQTCGLDDIQAKTQVMSQQLGRKVSAYPVDADDPAKATRWMLDIPPAIATSLDPKGEINARSNEAVKARSEQNGDAMTEAAAKRLLQAKGISETNWRGKPSGRYDRAMSEATAHITAMTQLQLGITEMERMLGGQATVGTAEDLQAIRFSKPGASSGQGSRVQQIRSAVNARVTETYEAQKGIEQMRQELKDTQTKAWTVGEKHSRWVQIGRVADFALGGIDRGDVLKGGKAQRTSEAIGTDQLARMAEMASSGAVPQAPNGGNARNSRAPVSGHDR